MRREDDEYRLQQVVERIHRRRDLGEGVGIGRRDIQFRRELPSRETAGFPAALHDVGDERFIEPAGSTNKTIQWIVLSDERRDNPSHSRHAICWRGG